MACQGGGFVRLSFMQKSAEALQNIKSQAPNLRVSGVGCQVSGKKDKKTET
jgi:hypothetical protein